MAPHRGQSPELKLGLLGYSQMDTSELLHTASI